VKKKDSVKKMEKNYIFSSTDNEEVPTMSVDNENKIHDEFKNHSFNKLDVPIEELLNGIPDFGKPVTMTLPKKFNYDHYPQDTIKLQLSPILY
jgi:hypothetical protein